MAYQSRSATRAAAARRAKPPPETREARLTIPDALVAWAQDAERQMRWAHPYGQEVAALLQAAQDAPLPPDATERLLSRLDALVSAARAEGRRDLLVGFDLQTAEWLGLHIHAETPRGHLHVGPDPSSCSREGAMEPPWTYSEIRVVYDAATNPLLSASEAKSAVDLAWRAKELLVGIFPEARFESLELNRPLTRCLACGEVATGVMMATDGGCEYHTKCWSEMTSRPPPRAKR